MRPKVEAWAHGVRILAKNSKAVYPVGIYWLGAVVPVRVAVPAKEFPWSRLYDSLYRGCPDIGLLLCNLWRGGGQLLPQINPRP